MANTVLESRNDKQGIAVIFATSALDNLDNYQTYIENLLKDNKKWFEFIRLKLSPDLNSSLPYPLGMLHNIIKSRNSIKNVVKSNNELLLSYCIDEVVLCHPFQINEASLAYAAYKSNIKLSLYDETVYEGYHGNLFLRDKGLMSTKKNRLKLLLKPFVFRLIYGKYYKFGNIDQISFESYYSLFTDLYPYQNVRFLKKSVPKFANIGFSSTSLLITSSLSEDGIITLEEELVLIKLIIFYLPADTVVKFHPRDSHEKKEKILELSGFKELDLKVEAAEMLINSPKLQKISGYLSSALLVASALRPELEINAFLGCLNNNRINKLDLIRIKNDFPRINFHCI